MVIGPSSGDEEIPFVDNRNQEASEELTSIMLDERNPQIWHCWEETSSYSVTGSRYQGYKDAHEKMGVPAGYRIWSLWTT